MDNSLQDEWFIGAMSNCTTNCTCPYVGGRDTWWVYLVTSFTIYLIGLGLSTVAFTLKKLTSNKKEKTCKRNTSRRRCTDKTHKSFRDFFRQLLLGDSIHSKILITLNLVCNIIYILLGIIRSYSPVAGEHFYLGNKPEKILEIVVVGELIVFAVVKFIASTNTVLYWFSPYTIVDVFTLPHIFVSAFLGMDWIGLRSLRFLWLTQITSVLRFLPFINHDFMDIISLMIYFLVLWLTSSGVIHLLETQGDPWDHFKNGQCNSFLLYAYLIMATVSTVGYGDIVPKTDLGRTFVTFFIIAGLAFFAAILPKLAEVTSSYYERSQYSSFDTSRVPQHVIVCGHITAVTAEDFLKDFLHPDRGDNKTHILFLHPGKPNTALRYVLRSYYTRVQYLDGSVLNSYDLQKAKINISRAIFILANKHAHNPTEEDQANLLRLVSVKNTKDDISVIIQLLHSFSKKQVYNIAPWKHSDVALCLNELKLGLLAQSCLCPGFSTLIANLFYTSDFPTHHQGEDEESVSWKELYIKGASNEIYSSPFSDFFWGNTFLQAARLCYNQFNLVLLAIESGGKMYVNPSTATYHDLTISHRTNGYFIAQNQEQVIVVKNYHPRSYRSSLLLVHSTLRRVSSLARRSHYHRESQPLEPLNHEEVLVNIDSSESTTNLTGPRKNVTTDEFNGTLSDTLQQHHDERLFDTLSYLEDSREGRKFHMYVSEPNRLEKAIINPDMAFLDSTSVQPTIDIKDHIVICIFADGNSPLLGLHCFLKPLRNKYLPSETIKPVVIVSDKAFIEKEWTIIRNIPKVYVVVGSPLRWSNLRSAKVSECSVCVILTVPSGSANHEQGINDKEAILCSLSIQNSKKLNRCKKTVQVITDLRQESNVQFLDFADEDEPDERIYKAQPFACGEAFSASMFDSVTSSAFHSPGIMHLVESLIHVSGNNSLCRAVPIPISGTSFCNMKFKEFYNSQLNDGNICMGISRKMKTKGENPPQRFVITSPDPKLELEQSDIAFVLTEETSSLNNT